MDQADRLDEGQAHVQGLLACTSSSERDARVGSTSLSGLLQVPGWAMENAVNYLIIKSGETTLMSANSGMPFMVPPKDSTLKLIEYGNPYFFKVKDVTYEFYEPDVCKAWVEVEKL